MTQMPSNNMTIIDMIQYNSKAIKLLQDKKFEEAIDAFTLALRVVKSECANEKETQSKTTSFRSEGVFRWAEAACEQQEGSSAFIYSRPLIITSLSSFPCDQSEIAAALLFNLALALHLRAASLGARGNSILEKVLSIYQRIIEILPECPLLETVILFNAGSIHEELFNFDKARACFQISEDFLFDQEAGAALCNIDRMAMIAITTTYQEPRVAAAA